VGALSKNSIWKMAHMSISKESPEEIAINAVNTMLLEMFLHGREEYEHLRKQLQKVCKEHNLWTTKLDEDFDARVLYWNEKYAT
jgi:1-deoxy-D-xylulose 5-phosphate reductoisomerase